MSICIRISANLQEGMTRVGCGGTDVVLISKAEIRSVKLNGFQLKRTVGRMVGKEPNGAYLREYTPWNI